MTTAMMAIALNTCTMLLRFIVLAVVSDVIYTFLDVNNVANIHVFVLSEQKK